MNRSDLRQRPVTIVIETVWASWARDFGTASSVLASFWVNHTYLGNNGCLSPPLSNGTGIEG
jgi:hypothetical protein